MRREYREDDAVFIAIINPLHIEVTTVAVYDKKAPAAGTAFMLCSVVETLQLG